MAYMVSARRRPVPFGANGARPTRHRRRRVLPALGDIPGAFAQQVEDWRDLVTQKAGDLPINFLMAWISRESAGSVCSFTNYGEAGIFQLMPGDNMTYGKTTPAIQHPVPPCAAGANGTSQGFSSVTPDIQDAQVQAGIDYINNYARPQAHKILDAAGYSWDESSGSFWQLVKMIFNYPAPLPALLANATAELGAPPPDWATWRATTAVQASGLGSALNNAEFVGAYGAGGGSFFASPTSPGSLLVIAGGLALFSYLYWSR